MAKMKGRRRIIITKSILTTLALFLSSCMLLAPSLSSLLLLLPPSSSSSPFPSPLDVIKLTPALAEVKDIDTVDAIGDTGMYTDITRRSGCAERYISYYDATNDGDGNLRVAYSSTLPNQWKKITVDLSGDVGRYSSIAMGSNCSVHISYYDATHGDLKYAKGVAGLWSTETIDFCNYFGCFFDVGRYSSIAIDSNNVPHISYYDATLGDLMYAKKSGGVWTQWTVDNPGDVGLYTSIAIDSNNVPHISYYDATNHNLKYAKKSGGVWTKETVDSPGDVGEYSSIALDANSNPHISYHNDDTDELMYAKKVQGNWVKQVVDSTGNVARYTSIMNTPSGRQISYHSLSGTALKWALVE